MNPNINYQNLSISTIDYLHTFLETYCGAYSMGIKLNKKELFDLEASICTQVIAI